MNNSIRDRRAIAAMADAIVNSSAWDGSAKTAEELLEHCCSAEIRDLYAEMDLAEDELAEAVVSGEIIPLSNGTYERVRDGAII